jgi:hypothetical protein
MTYQQLQMVISGHNSKLVCTKPAAAAAAAMHATAADPL